MAEISATPAPAARRYDVIAIGNAIVDVMAPAADDAIAALGLAKGGMTLVDADRAAALYAAMGPAREISGGSAANTLAGLAALGASCAFIGQVADDQFGRVFAHDIRAGGIAFDTAARAGDPPTAQCLIFVTPDGRTMNTFLGASQFHQPPRARRNRDRGFARALPGRLSLGSRRAPRRHAQGDHRRPRRRHASGLHLSDAFVISRHGDDFRALIADGLIDILFANEHELAALTGQADFHDGMAALRGKVPTLVVTRGEHGAHACHAGEEAHVSAQPIAKVVDTTGAGDLRAGFLYGHVRGLPLAESLRLGAVCAAEVIAHYGARPEADLRH
jgi:sugar/nucleoside kinase (ribokinase family)